VGFLKSGFINSKPATATLILVLATACSGAPPEPIPIEEQLAAKGYLIKEPVKRIKDYRINGWSSVDRRNVILNVGASKNYLVTVRSPCDGLRSAEHLAFSTIIGDLTDKDKLISETRVASFKTVISTPSRAWKRSNANKRHYQSDNIHYQSDNITRVNFTARYNKNSFSQKAVTHRNFLLYCLY